MSFVLSERSLQRLQGVHPELVRVAKRAIEVTQVDFAITEGLRSPERQLEMYNRKLSQIAKGGTHVQGLAVDTMAYEDGHGSWDISLYDNVADGFKQAAIDCGVGVRWGGAWHIPDIRYWEGTMQECYDDYIKTRREQGQRPFIDAVHFELAQ